jgi:hypothetical protein
VPPLDGHRLARDHLFFSRGFFCRGRFLSRGFGSGLLGRGLFGGRGSLSATSNNQKSDNYK